MSAPCPRCGAAITPPGPCPACHLRAALKKPAAPDLEGVQLGRYVVGNLLGEGSMGWVYEALDTWLGITVALKILAEDLDERAELLQEARLAASLRHDRIVRVLEAGEHEGISYFTMDRIEGGSLRAPIADPKRAAEVVRDIARAVGFAHGKGILHRDLKPQNVLLDADGRVFVTDFGLAARFDLVAGAALTAGGTPQYMAPEVLHGEQGAISTAADIWAVGAILYELLAGLPPFDARSIEALAHKLTEPPQPLTGAPADLVTVCFKCLEKDPARRHKTADELADELQRFLDDKPVLCNPRGPVERAVRLAARYPLSVALGAMFALAVAYIVIGALSLAHAQQTAYRAADFAARRAADVTAIQIERLAALVEAAARDPRVVRAAGEASTRACNDLFAQHANAPFDGWYMFDRQGFMTGRAPNVPRNNTGLSFAFRDYFRGAAQRAAEGRRTAYVSRAFQSEGDGAYEVALSVPVYDENGAWIGVLVGAMPTGAALATLDDVDDDRLTASVIAPRDRERDQDDYRSDSIFLLHRALRLEGTWLPVGAPADTSALIRRAPVRGTPFLVVVSFSYESSLPARLGRIEILIAWVPVVGLGAVVWALVRWVRRRNRLKLAPGR